ncbi:GABA transporter, putative [Ixodes scapularis]|uniref:Transporter n=1 Tax=Ixodes scapularis TaxID=6945 RepID=B7P1X3_IXOSC|nr:GABA transporter, putative [Ixodes scapularis]|eukprot:XP_002433531.1 GABA transporter, putative [Ixodes scapularis]
MKTDKKFLDALSSPFGVRRGNADYEVAPTEKEAGMPGPDEDVFLAVDVIPMKPESPGVGDDLGSSEEDLPVRGNWGGKLDFIFGCVSYAVGLGNVWRFPYLAYENGGGAFLVPFFISIILCGVPLFVMEVSIGQYLNTGGIGIWNLVPMFKGDVILVSLFVVSFFLLVDKFNVLWPLNWLQLSPSPLFLSLFVTVILPFRRNVLDITNGLEEVGSLRPELALYLLLAWFLVYTVIWRGLHQSGKIIWCTALFPYLILFILFIRGVTLEGASDGLLYYLRPDWTKLRDPRVWIAAGTQVLFSYGIGIGANVALGSYNKYNHNFYRVLSGHTVRNKDLFLQIVKLSRTEKECYCHGDTPKYSQKISRGPGLAFLAYPEMVVQLPFAPVWAVLFFLMLIVLGIDSQFCTVEALVTGLVDEFASTLRPYRRLFTLGVVIVQFLLGLPLVTQGGMYIFQLMDFFSASGVSLLTVVFFEIVGFAWIYGARRIYANIKDMIGFTPNKYFFFCWLFAAPCMIVGMLVFYIAQPEPVTYSDHYVYPWWGEMVGWGMALASITWIPTYAIYFLWNSSGSLLERIKKGVTPQVVPRKAQEGTPTSDESLTLDPPANSVRVLLQEKS